MTKEHIPGRTECNVFARGFATTAFFHMQGGKKIDGVTADHLFSLIKMYKNDSYANTGNPAGWYVDIAKALNGAFSMTYPELSKDVRASRIERQLGIMLGLEEAPKNRRHAERATNFFAHLRAALP